MNKQRIQKILSHLGYGSRRQLERYILQERVTVSGKIVVPGELIDRAEITLVAIDNKPIQPIVCDYDPCRVLIYYKPEGEICSRLDPQGRRVVFRFLPKLTTRNRWVMVGRLDINSSGLLLFTTDGELAHRLMHPSYQIERHYAVRVWGRVDGAVLQRLRTGVELDDGIARFNTIYSHNKVGKNSWFKVSLTEGKNREVRRLWQSQGVQVSRLIRIQYSTVKLPITMTQRDHIELNSIEVNKLRQQVCLN